MTGSKGQVLIDPETRAIYICMQEGVFAYEFTVEQAEHLIKAMTKAVMTLNGETPTGYALSEKLRRSLDTHGYYSPANDSNGAGNTLADDPPPVSPARAATIAALANADEEGW